MYRQTDRQTVLVVVIIANKHDSNDDDDHIGAGTAWDFVACGTFFGTSNFQKFKYIDNVYV